MHSFSQHNCLKVFFTQFLLHTQMQSLSRKIQTHWHSLYTWYYCKVYSLLSFLLSAAASLTSSLSSCTAMSQVLSHCLNVVSHRKEALDSPSNHKASEKRNFVLCAHTQADTCVFCASFWLNKCRRVASTSLYEDKVQQYYHSRLQITLTSLCCSWHHVWLVSLIFSPIPNSQNF